ncbi:MAG: 2-hydroxyglutaryl-CoA dehydratase [Deltaproteobacteria bacterium]|nr:2-hydroxyglutaryl-CoA dehydratase [Deltaproteobacteria bacterium]
MIVAGVDIGSSTSKAVLLGDDAILSYSIIFTGSESVHSANQVLDQVLQKSNLSFKDIQYIVATGYGRVIVPFAHEALTELTCHARGAHWLFPEVRTILDMGGQDCKAIRCDRAGRLQNFVMNDKCAAGTGRFLELMARVLGLSLDDLGEISLGAASAIKINSTCAVFAKSEVTSLIREGKERKEVIAGLHSAIAGRVYTLLRGVGIEPELAVSGGIGKNKGVVQEIEKRLGMKVLLPPEPQIVGALGAALFARDKLGNPT